MSRPLFSCVVPVKGPRPYFDEAVASLVNQGLGDELEIIIQDGTMERTEFTETVDVGNGKVKWFREADYGQSDALNKGFAKANGEWFFWLNADDVLLPEALVRVRDFIDQVDCVEWIAGNTIYVDKCGKVLGTRCDARWRPWFGKSMSVWTGGPSAFFRRGLWEKHGGFDTSLKFVMDLDLWTRWAQTGVRFKSIDEYLWGFRIHEGSATYKISNRCEIEREFQDVLRRFNIRNEHFWRIVTRMVSVFDGTRWCRTRDTFRFRGKELTDCMGISK